MANNAPNSYKDPFWTDLATATEAKLGLPQGLLAAVVTKGERSNADQVSEAGARTPFQIIPATRDAAIKKFGIDPYLSAENAAEVAGLLLKDSLTRNKGDTATAVAEYHGGTNPANWGPRTKAYVARVLGDQQAVQQGGQPTGGSTFQRALARQQSVSPNAIAAVYDAYRSGKMSPQEMADFESDVKNGLVMLPKGATLAGQSAPSPTGKPEPVTLPMEVTNAYVNGKMSETERAELEADMKAGLVKLPPTLTSQIPGGEGWTAPTEQGIIQRPREPSIGERLIGAGEAALTTVTGGTGGMVGMVAGTVEGITKSILDGTYGTKQGADNAERIAMERAGQLTYQPRTEQGMEHAQAVGNAMQQLIPIAPLAGEMAAISQATRAAAPAMRAGAGIAADAAKRGATATVEAVKPPVVNAVEAVRNAPRRAAEMVGLAEPQPAVNTGGRASAGAAATPQDLLRSSKAENLPVPIELTKGAETRDAAQLAFEKEQIKNPTLGAPLRARAEENNLQALQNFDKLIDMTEAQSPDLSTTGNTVTKALAEGYKAAKNKTNVAYRAARNSEEAKAPVDPNTVVQIGEGENAINNSLIGYLNERVQGTPSAAVTDTARKLLIKMGLAEEVSGYSGVELKPGLDGAVWLTKDPVRAETYARNAAEKTGGKPIVFRVRETDAIQDPNNFGDAYTRSTAGPVKIDSVAKPGLKTAEDGFWYHGTSDTVKPNEGILIGKPTTVGKMEDFRRELSGTAKWDDRVGIREETILKKLVDAQTDPVAGPLYKAARATREAQARKYENRAVVARLVQTVRGMEDPKVAADQVFQKSIMTSSPEEITFLKRVLNTSGKDGQQAWKELQGSLVRHIQDEATKGMGMDSADRPIISPAKLHQTVSALDKNGRLDIVLGKKNAEVVRDLNDVVRYVNTTPPGTLINNSGTAGVLMAAMAEAGTTGALTGLPVPVMSGLRMLAKQINNAKTRAKIQDALNVKSNKF